MDGSGIKEERGKEEEAIRRLTIGKRTALAAGESLGFLFRLRPCLRRKFP